MNESTITVSIIKSDKYVKQFPFVDDKGIYMPLEDYVLEGCAGAYKCVMTKEMFIEAYNKWIRDNTANSI